MASFDSIVLGLGGMGSAALLHLASRGQRVLGLEAFTPPHDRGSSHGESRIIRQAYYEHPAYVPLLLRAYEFWADLQRSAGKPLLLQTGGIFVGTADSPVVAGSLRSAREHGLPHEVLSGAEIHRRWPLLAPAADEIGLFEARSGVLLVEECVRSHLDAAVRRGAEAHFAEPALQWAARQGGVEVTTRLGRYAPERLVITGGACNPALLAALGLPLSVERQTMVWFDPGRRRDEFAPGRLPIWLWQRPGEIAVYGFPDLGGPGVKAAFHHGGETTTPEQIRRGIDDAEVQRLRSVLAGRVPALAGPLAHAVTCMYTNTPDDHFVIGLHPEYPQVVVGGGFSGHGFKFAPVVGEVLADLATQGATPQPIELFAPTRFAKK